ncbi:MAG: response regulator transcription factor [Candidatus Eisenbacteria bacterium]|uniref:Response regulator transcription factor n=1 Tax=Eiseniibacteriota bacterium TaxID=2212470 RepID=A0A538TEB7_UNCEI|nr:MAG: response regulator transcription factor [Candidatus Eisenbacteria bacterium]
MIRVLIADDHAVLRRGLADVLSEERDMVVRGEAGSCREVLSKLRQGEWDVVVLDLNFPDGNGLDLLREIKRERPKLPILILTIASEDHYAVRALRSGASGYLTKESAPEELVQAVRKVVAGGRYVSPKQAERLAVMIDRDAEQSPHDQLSEREFQVFRLLASGRAVSQVAEDLHISVKTVSTYRARVLEKMNLRTNAELTVYAVRNHLVE